MVKMLDFIDETIFNYLGFDDYAVFISQTGLLDGITLSESNTWVQYDENEQITAMVSILPNGNSLIFSNENADREELSFITGEEKSIVDKKYLLKKIVPRCDGKKGISSHEYERIKALNPEDRENHRDIVIIKTFLNSMDKCEGALISKNNEDVCGGFITFSQKISLITDVYTNEAYRGKGYGKALIEKLLKLSVNENVYLVSQEHNLGFYKKCGFEIVKEIYQHSTEEK